MTNVRIKHVTYGMLAMAAAACTLLPSTAWAKNGCLDRNEIAKMAGEAAREHRCGKGLSREACTDVNNLAASQDLICKDAFNWLQNEKLCAVSFMNTLVGVCPMGCFEANTNILTLDSSTNVFVGTPAKDIAAQDALATLQVASTLDEPLLEASRVDKVVFGPEEPELFVFTLDNGNELRVTQEHAMVLEDGSVIRANQVVVGDAFVSVQGDAVEVVQVSRATSPDDVFNFDLAGDAMENHVLVANDIFVGDLSLQNTADAELESISLR